MGENPVTRCSSNLRPEIPAAAAWVGAKTTHAFSEDGLLPGSRHCDWNLSIGCRIDDRRRNRRLTVTNPARWAEHRAILAKRGAGSDRIQTGSYLSVTRIAVEVARLCRAGLHVPGGGCGSVPLRWVAA